MSSCGTCVGPQVFAANATPRAGRGRVRGAKCTLLKNWVLRKAGIRSRAPRRLVAEYSRAEYLHLHNTGNNKIKRRVFSRDIHHDGGGCRTRATRTCVVVILDRAVKLVRQIPANAGHRTNQHTFSVESSNGLRKTRGYVMQSAQTALVAPAGCCARDV